ncbi:tetratricopeptide repeat protein [Methanosarcina sp. T3]|uniref:tetratricopeptide repeat protein n=1 Tax=Methanosarcina sp. T3 TaxID=3439062 RepID=UPI003F83D7DD
MNEKQAIEKLQKVVTEYLESNKENFDEAVKLATIFSIENSISDDSFLEKARLYISRESYSLAYIFAKAGVILSTEDTKKATAYNISGVASYFMGRNSEAEEQYKLAIESDPNDVDTHSNYGIFLSEMGRPSEAEEQYKLAIESDPNNVDTHSNYGNLLSEMGRPSEAEEQYKLAIESDPNNVDTHYNYGILLKQMGRPSEAEEQYKLAIESDPNNVDTHSNYGNLLSEMGRPSEAEEQYKLAIESGPNDVDTHYNYGILLKQMGRPSETEEQYKLAIESDPNDVDTHSNYGILLKQMGRPSEAEEQYKLAIESDPNNVDTHYNYGILLKQMGRPSEAEEQYKLAIESDPNNVDTHSNYGILLSEMGRPSEAEEQYKLAIELDPKSPNAHGAYSLLLLSLGLEKEEDAMEEMKIASRLFGEKGDRIKEHLVLAWLYEELANTYYNLKKYFESGKYAELSGIEYVKASEQDGTKSKETFVTKGYMLKGRAYIRKLNLQPPYDEKIYEKIMDGIYAASKCYQKAAEASPKDNQMCNACSLSMKCLSEILNYMLAVTKQEKVQKLKVKVKEWEKNLEICKSAYDESDKGKKFVQSLNKMIVCIENFEEYKQYNTWVEKRDLKECTDDLIEIAKNIEGPLQKVIEEATKQMDHCKSETLYMGTKTKPFMIKDTSSDLESRPPIELKHDSGSNPNPFFRILKLIREEPIIAGIIVTVVGGIIVIFIQKKYFP